MEQNRQHPHTVFCHSFLCALFFFSVSIQTIFFPFKMICQTEQPNWILPIQSQIKSFRHNVCVRCICDKFEQSRWIFSPEIHQPICIVPASPTFRSIYRIIIQQQLPNFQKETNKGCHHLTLSYFKNPQKWHLNFQCIRWLS